MGARRVHIGVQFVGEAVCISVLGGLAGSVIGALTVMVYASLRHWSTSVAPGVLAGAAAVALAVGGVGGLYPAWRASRLSPAEALRST